MPIAPAAHYQMGGIWTDARGRTSLDGLWAIGEVAATGVHGANRLASNSLLESIVFGARAAADLAHMTLTSPRDRIEPRGPLPSPNPDDLAILDEVRDLMSANVGVIRDAASLSGALGELRRMKARARDIETLNMLVTAQLVAAAAFARRESRGAHFRQDYPAPDAAFAHRSSMTLAMALRIADEACA
jgi:L-aspartate oxidase